MAGEPSLTLAGNLVADPEVRFTKAGKPVCNFRLASTPRRYDRDTSAWVDGEALFMSCTVWGDAAGNVAESLHRGARVLVTGTVRSKQYETREGERRTSIELEVDEVGPSLKFASATVNKRSAYPSSPAGVAAAPSTAA